MKKLLTTSLLFLYAFCLFAQTTFTGKVIDEQNKIIDIGNVIVLSQSDSTLVAGDAFFDGAFSITIDEPATKLLKIESFGFAGILMELPENGGDLGEIRLEKSAITLKSAVVKAKRLSLFTQKNGVLEINVAQTALSSSGTAIDVLKASPGIFITGDSDVNMFGKGVVKIYIDGEEISTPDIIKNLNSEQIKKIEVMRNPSAKYDASGKGGVINIITKDAGLEGLLGRITVNTTKATYQRGYLDGSLSYKKGKWGLYGSLDWNPYKVYEYQTFYREIDGQEHFSILKNTVNEDELSILNNNYTGKISYAINDKHKISASIKGKVKKGDDLRHNINTIEEDDILTNTLTSISNQKRKTGYTILNAKYTFQDTLGKVLSISATHTQFNFSNVDFVDEDYSETNTSLKRKNEGMNAIDINLLKLDYEQTIFNDFAKMEAGLKYSTTKNSSETQYFLDNEGEWLSNPAYNSGYEYEENNAAAYLSFSKELGKWGFRGGIRYENSHSLANSVASGSFLDTIYSNFFPTAGIGYKLTEEMSIDLAYTSRIRRPSFQDLDPYVTYLDSFSLLRGNPGLRPEIVHSIEANFAYSGYPLLTVGYSDTQNPIYIMVEKDANNELINAGVSKNLNYEKHFFSQITIPYQNKWWTSGNGIGYDRRELQFDDFNQGVPLVKNSYFIFSYQDFNVKGWNFGTQYIWFSPGIQGIFEYSSGATLNAWVGKKFLDGKLNVKLLFNDILKSSIVTAHAQVGNLYIEQVEYEDTRQARIVFTYKFGKLTTSQRGKDRSSKEFGRIKLD